MLNSLNDYLSFLSIIFIVFLGCALFINSFFSNHNRDTMESSFKEFLNYTNNTDE